MKDTRRLTLSLAAGLLTPTTGAMATLVVCYESYTWQCCSDWTIKCTHTSIVEPPEQPVVTNWVCLQDSDSFGFATQAAKEAQSGQHLSNVPGYFRGSCMITPRTCGALPTVCIVGTPYQAECRDSDLYGSCTANP